MTAGPWTLPAGLQWLIESGWWPYDYQSEIRQNLHSLIPEDRVRDFAPEESTIYFNQPPFSRCQFTDGLGCGGSGLRAYVRHTTDSPAMTAADDTQPWRKQSGAANGWGRPVSHASQKANGGRHRLFGHSENIQGDMQMEAQLVMNGIYCGNPTGYNDPRRAELEANCEDWILLLQLDSDDARPLREHVHVSWRSDSKAFAITIDGRFYSSSKVFVLSKDSKFVTVAFPSCETMTGFPVPDSADLRPRGRSTVKGWDSDGRLIYDLFAIPLPIFTGKDPLVHRVYLDVSATKMTTVKVEHEKGEWQHGDWMQAKAEQGDGGKPAAHAGSK